VILHVQQNLCPLKGKKMSLQVCETSAWIEKKKEGLTGAIDIAKIYREPTRAKP